MTKKKQSRSKVIKEKKSSHVPYALRVSMGIIAIKATTSICDVAKVLEKNHIGAVIVKSDSAMVGIVSERDIVYRVVAKRKPYKNLKAKDIMTRAVVTVNIEDGIKAIHDQMKNIPFRHLPVRKGHKIVGMVSNRDLMYLRRLKTIHS